MLWFLQLFTAPNSFFEIRTCFKCSNFHSWDFDFLLWISWVNTCSSFSFRRFECTKTLNSYFTTFFDRINDRSDKDSDEIPSESLGNTKFFCYQVNKLSFSHDRIIQNIKSVSIVRDRLCFARDSHLMDMRLSCIWPTLQIIVKMLYLDMLSYIYPLWQSNISLTNQKNMLSLLFMVCCVVICCVSLSKYWIMLIQILISTCVSVVQYT